MYVARMFLDFLENITRVEIWPFGKDAKEGIYFNVIRRRRSNEFDEILFDIIVNNDGTAVLNSTNNLSLPVINGVLTSQTDTVTVTHPQTGERVGLLAPLFIACGSAKDQFTAKLHYKWHQPSTLFIVEFDTGYHNEQALKASLRPNVFAMNIEMLAAWPKADARLLMILAGLRLFYTLHKVDRLVTLPSPIPCFMPQEPKVRPSLFYLQSINAVLFRPSLVTPQNKQIYTEIIDECTKKVLLVRVQDDDGVRSYYNDVFGTTLFYSQAISEDQIEVYSHDQNVLGQVVKQGIYGPGPAYSFIVSPASRRRESGKLKYLFNRADDSMELATLSAGSMMYTAVLQFVETVPIQHKPLLIVAAHKTACKHFQLNFSKSSIPHAPSYPYRMS